MYAPLLLHCDILHLEPVARDSDAGVGDDEGTCALASSYACWVGMRAPSRGRPVLALQFATYTVALCGSVDDLI